MENVKVQIMDDVIQALIQTDKWFEIQGNDPMILHARANYERVLEKVKPFVSRELIQELDEAALMWASACDFPAILYGILVADSLRSVVASPSDLSKAILARMEGRE